MALFCSTGTVFAQVTVSLPQSIAFVTENARFATLPIETDRLTTESLTVNLLYTGDPGALTGTFSSVDIPDVSTTVTIDTHLMTTQTFRVDIVDDEIAAEFTRTVNIMLQPGDGYLVSGTENTVALRISENDFASASFSQSAGTVTEGEAIELTVIKNLASDSPAAVNVSFTSMGNFFESQSIATARVSFPAEVAMSRQTIIIPTVNDLAVEPDGFLRAQLEIAPGSTVNPGLTMDVITVTVLDNDVAAISFAQAEYTIPEGAPITVTLIANPPPVAPVQISLTTVGTTIAEGRYQLPTMLVFDTGESMVSFDVIIENDNVFQADQELHLSFNLLDDIAEYGETSRTVITVEDLTPHLNNNNEISSQTAVVGQPFTFDASMILGDVFSGDGLTYSSGANERPNWLSFDATDLTFSGTPNAANGDVGATTVTVTASNSAGSVSTTFLMTVTAPINIVSLVLRESGTMPVNAVQVGASYRAQVMLTASARSTVTFSVIFEDNEIIRDPIPTTNGLADRVYTVPSTNNERSSSPSHVVVEATADTGYDTEAGNDILASYSVHYPISTATLTNRTDSDGDGVPNYLDANDDATTELRIVGGTTLTRVMEVPNGHDIRLGNLARVGMTYSAQLRDEVIPDPIGYADEGIYDFVVHLPMGERAAYVVIPLANTIDVDKVWGKWDGTWGAFREIGGDRFYSAAGMMSGNSLDCPDAGPDNLTAWEEGLWSGDDCVQLVINDGGFNDADGEANGIVVDPGAPTTGRGSPRGSGSGIADFWFLAILLGLVTLPPIIRRFGF